MVLTRPVDLSGRQRTILLAVAVAILAALLGWTIRAGVDSRDRNAVWRTGTGYVGADQFSVCTHGWCYSANGPVEWVDSAGTVHMGTWPECLKHDQKQKITFAAGSVKIHGREVRPIIQVRC